MTVTINCYPAANCYAIKIEYNEATLERLRYSGTKQITHSGDNYYENYQLFCGCYNSTKGARPMEYLRNKVKAWEFEVEKEFFFGRSVRRRRE